MSDYKVEETKFGIKTSHPSYGTLAFSRRTGGAPLYLEVALSTEILLQ